MNGHMRMLAVTFIISMLAMGCGASDMTITADTVRYPVSLTQGLYDAEGRIHQDEDYHVIETFSFPLQRTTWLWNMVEISPNHDISHRLDSLVERAGGQAIVNMKITPKTWTTVLSWFLGFGLLLPTSVEADISGEIVSIKQ